MDVYRIVVVREKSDDKMNTLKDLFMFHSREDVEFFDSGSFPNLSITTYLPKPLPFSSRIGSYRSEIDRRCLVSFESGLGLMRVRVGNELY